MAVYDGPAVWTHSVNFGNNSHVTLCFPADLLVKAAAHNVDVGTDVFKACSFTPVRHQQSCDSSLHFPNINSWIFAC